jgi:hypothetical protein
MPAKKATSPVPTLRDICLDEIGSIAAEIANNSPTPLSKAQSIALAARTPAGYSAYNWYRSQFSHLPVGQAVTEIVKSELAKDTATKILAKRQQVAKEGGSGGSGPRGGMIESPKTTGPKAPADTLPAQSAARKISAPISPSDAILAAIHAQALRAAPAGTSQEQATAAFLQTTAGQQLHRQFNAAIAAKRE